MEYQMRAFKIGTFCEKGEKRISKVRAYTNTYNPSWKDCVEYEVVGRNSAYAKHEAKKLRLEDESKEAPDEQG